MVIPYKSKELDDILLACLEFKEFCSDEPFAEFNISGRGNVPVRKGRDLKNKMKYIAGLNLYLLEYLGFGNDNIEYFDLGPRAKEFISEGGFEKYFQTITNSINEVKKEIAVNMNESSTLQCDYVIITALEEKEMENVLGMLTKVGSLNNTKHLIEYGYLNSNPEKHIAWASQQSTGMIDASILATEMLIRFNPKFLIMPGVLGGKPKDTNIGDIIVSTKVFTIDKGKLTDEELKKEIESVNTDNAYVAKFRRNKSKIISFINGSDPTKRTKVEIHFEPIACVRQVIDQKGYFSENITPIDRKAIALEMESYGIAKACELVNNGHTIPLIIKSVMDNTQKKTDNAKNFAAWTSAMFVRYVLENKLI